MLVSAGLAGPVVSDRPTAEVPLVLTDETRFSLLLDDVPDGTTGTDEPSVPTG